MRWVASAASEVCEVEELELQWENPDERDWSSAGLTSVSVKRFLGDDEDRWFMWCSGLAGGESRTERVGLATSSDGVQWTWHRGEKQDCAVFDRNVEDWWWFDTKGVRVSHVDMLNSDVIRGGEGVLFMYYDGEGNSRERRVGVSLSKDGIHWSRLEGEHHSGALWESHATQPHLFDTGTVSAPEHRLYYFGESGALESATSTDGLKWKPKGTVHLQISPHSPFNVCRISSVLLLLCTTSPSSSTQQLTIHHSTDQGETWTPSSTIQLQHTLQHFSIVDMSTSILHLYGIASQGNAILYRIQLPSSII